MKRRRRWSFRAWCVLVFVAMLSASAIAVRVSVMTSSVRLLLLATFGFGLVIGVFYVVRLLTLNPRALLPMVFLLVMFVVWVVAGGKPPDADQLRNAYTGRLHSFEGTRYVWGGETEGGIDCSGLARVAMWQAMLVQGVRELNPRMLGPRLWKFWWRDLSAQAIGRGQYGYTRELGRADKLAGYGTSDLLPGDMAVAGGVHVMIYYGDGHWIDAAPDNRKVVISTAPSGSERGWYNTPVVLVRWRILDSPPAR